MVKSPRREAGNKTLNVKNELWMYLRNTETTIKVPPSMMLQSWNGSDFTNDDLVRESSLAEDYTMKLLGRTNDGQCRLVENRADSSTHRAGRVGKNHSLDTEKGLSAGSNRIF
ncbi:MAG: outer membrane lipoprotein-sorting protein [Ignavibacteriales bacterium]|nr:outer membrane lipoprotein-sorting protein [Ignavibacteriales bacterium]